MSKVDINLKAKGRVPNELTGTITTDQPLFDAGVTHRVALVPASSTIETPDQILWSAIRNRTHAANFVNFERFVDGVFCRNPATALPNRMRGELDALTKPCYHGTDAYKLLKAAAEIFLALQCGIRIEPLIGRDGAPGDPDDPVPGEAEHGAPADTFRELRDRLAVFLRGSSQLYLDTILNALGGTPANSPLCEGLLRHPGNPRDPFANCFPCLLELIWSYWHEEGMLVQTLNALCLRFQNRRGPHAHDPLATLRLDPLRPLNTLLWGYIQDEHERLTVARRAYEYDHEYGLRLVGRAVSDLQPVESRRKFLPAFHNLLYVTSRFYKEADDATIRADAFPVLNALRELHLVLAQGAHNQFGDLPWTARVEMLVQKWLLARPEIHEFLGRAPMVPYKESWMAQADAMKTLQGWTDVSVSHFRDLGVFGEQLLLSVRHLDWNSDDVTQASASNWALYWRAEVQSYIHSYRAVTGVDLSSEITDTRSAAERDDPPALHQMRRLNLQSHRVNGANGALKRDAVLHRR